MKTDQGNAAKPTPELSAAHTPLPWHWFSRIDKSATDPDHRYIKESGERLRHLVGADGQGFALTVGLSADTDEANAELIVRAVNAHDALVAAVKLALTYTKGQLEHAVVNYPGKPQATLGDVLRNALALAYVAAASPVQADEVSQALDKVREMFPSERVYVEVEASSYGENVMTAAKILIAGRSRIVASTLSEAMAKVREWQQAKQESDNYMSMFSQTNVGDD